MVRCQGPGSLKWEISDKMPKSSQTQRIARVIQEYDGHDWHRSGTEADHVSARWLAEQVNECGLEPELERFDLSRVDPELAHMEIGGQRVEGVPLFDGGSTGPDGVRGRTGLLGSDAEIGVVEVGPDLRANFMEARTAGIHQTEGHMTCRRSAIMGHPSRFC